MSIDYSANIYYGYALDEEELKSIPEDIYEELLDNEQLHRLDCYSDHSRVILGFEVEKTTSIVEFSPMMAVINNKVLDVAKLYHKCFSKYPIYNPTFFLGLRVS